MLDPYVSVNGSQPSSWEQHNSPLLSFANDCDRYSVFSDNTWLAGQIILGQRADLSTAQSCDPHDLCHKTIAPRTKAADEMANVATWWKNQLSSSRICLRRRCVPGVAIDTDLVAPLGLE